MDAYAIINALNQVLDLGDSLDNTGVVGVRALTDGDYSTRQACQLELGQFLLYIANGNGMITESEATIINLAFGSDYSVSQLRQLASTIDAPNPANSLSLRGFLTGDAALTQQNGRRTTSGTDILINLFEAFGGLMVAMDENPTSKARCAKHISGMKTYVMKNL